MFVMHRNKKGVSALFSNVVTAVETKPSAITTQSLGTDEFAASGLFV